MVLLRNNVKLDQEISSNQYINSFHKCYWFKLLVVYLWPNVFLSLMPQNVLFVTNNQQKILSIWVTFMLLVSNTTTATLYVNHKLIKWTEQIDNCNLPLLRAVSNTYDVLSLTSQVCFRIVLED